MKSAKEKERELIIKLHNEKKTCRYIASILGTSKSKVSFWINRYKKSGTLDDKPRSGRPTKLTEQKLGTLKQEIATKISEAGKKRAGISSKEVMELLQKETGKKYTLRHVQRVLRKIGFSLITPRVAHIRKDEKAQKKFRNEFKKNFDRNIWAIQ
jgi:transposase